MEYMPGTLSPEEMAQMQMFADALRAPGIQQSSFNPTQGGGMQMPQNGALSGVSAGMQIGKPLANSFGEASGGVPGGTADFVPYSW
jgi:hypothetical protein